MEANRDYLNKIKTLQKKTNRSLIQCKQALDESEKDINQAIMWLRKRGVIQSPSKNEFLKSCATLSRDWAEGFLSTAQDSGELSKYYNSGQIDIIQENYFSWNILGVPGVCPFLIFEKDLEHTTDDEEVELIGEVEELYNNAVSQLLPNYIQK
jgi:hypothetical protein